MKIVERSSRVGTGVGRTSKKSGVTHNPLPSTERGKRRAAAREAARKALENATEND